VNGRLSATIALYLLFLAAWSILNAARGEPGGRSWIAGLLIVYVALAVQAASVFVSVLADGDGPADPATFWPYLATSILLLPAAGARLAAVPSGTRSLSLALALVALAVVVWRLTVLWEAE
jgi:hypothetical protein